MKIFIFLLLILFPSISFSQGITVDTTTLSVPQLVRNELMQNSCSNLTNFVFSSHKGIGQFTNTNALFPISNGIIIRNGIAKYTEGTYTGINESSQITTTVALDVQSISDNNGQTAPITDVAFIQFDFTPLSSNFSFDFLFASNEYGQYQCGFSDVFAFLLTDLTTDTTVNLAVIPGTAIPVSVKNIRDFAYNSSCLSANANLFSTYNVSNSATSAINMRGETVLLKASSTVIPNRTYRIKLAIGDYNDSNLDSAVFIKGGSFTTTTNLGPDQTICQSENILLDSGLGINYNYSWTLNGSIIPGATTATLKATQAGTYGINAVLPASGCTITDEVTLFDLQTISPKNLSTCYTGQTTYQYDLTQNNLVALGLNSDEYSIQYFDSLASANANGPQIPAAQVSSYTSIGNQTLYIKAIHISNGNTICDNLLSFNLLVNAPIKATTPPPLSFCDNNSGTVMANLTVQNAVVLNGQNTASYIISYFTSQYDAHNNINPIANPSAFPITIAQSVQTIWVRMVDVSNSSCFNSVNFDVTVSPLPPVDIIPNAIECSKYILPPINNGNYYTGTDKTGLLLNAGDVIHNGGTYYISNGPYTSDRCMNQSSFTIILIDEISIPTTGCGHYIIPAPPAGNFFTAPSGAGTQIPAGTVLTSDQTIYYYAVINGVVCRDEALVITIFPLPLVDSPDDVVTCNSYTLPPLNNGNYFSGPGGTGNNLNAGDVLTSSQNVYVFAIDGLCTNQDVFSIYIVDTSLYQPIFSCGSYTLPAVPFGNYYDQPLGAGTIISAGTVIRSLQTVYYYVNTSTAPNCTANLSYQITIQPVPEIIDIADETRCEDDYFILPYLSNGSYYDQPNGGGNKLKEGNPITLSGTYYIYDTNSIGCTAQDLFTITYRKKPDADSFTDVFTCNGFTLQTLNNGTYYTASGGRHGVGSVIPSGTVITTSQTIYIYNEWNDFSSCSSETFFKVDAAGIEVGTFTDVNSCDSYTLPMLTIGNYYSQSNGKGPIISAGTVVTTSQTIYVYAIAGSRLTCSDEDNFIVTISATPILARQPDVEACGRYALPSLLLGNYFSGPNGTGTRYVAGQNIFINQIMYIYAVSQSSPGCSTQDQFNITVYPLRNLVIEGGVLCVDLKNGALLNPLELVTGLNPAIFTAEWYLNGTLMGTGVNYNAIYEGTYTVSVLKKTIDTGDDCNYNPTTVLVEKSSLASANITVTAPFEDRIDIVATINSGFGSYEYQLDNGSYQTNNVFQDVPSGRHSISINDTKGDCGAITLFANVLKYPIFFTPNADGYHDNWNIWDLADQPDAIIYLYDRYGKLIKQLSPAGPGWDGTSNGYPLPSADYWFQVFYKNSGAMQEFKSHFSMRR
ncbi:choice-of-anchor L domain-containing protein [Flavobacterium sp. XS2P39]|uniref:T9SS type B sorting domain-containing protein n=1 Tax=Flavobacterium sp. XS2P39 TaxID=3401725 RepID=UPI003AAD03EB